MNRSDFEALKPWLLLTDTAMLAYWAITVAKATGWLDVPAEWLYPNADDPFVVSWNWSFLPLDIVFSITGLVAAELHRRDHPGWRVVLPISLALTWCAGFMALAFWFVRGEFDLVWWLANGFLVLWPMAFLPRIWATTTGS